VDIDIIQNHVKKGVVQVEKDLLGRVLFLKNLFLKKREQKLEGLEEKEEEQKLEKEDKFQKGVWGKLPHLP